MKVSLSWLKELVDHKLSPNQLADKLSLTSIGVKELTGDYLELDLTYNRGDLLSLRGVARELAAVTNSQVLFSAADPSNYLRLRQNLPKTPVAIADEKLSAVQCVAKIEGLSVEPSNKKWIKKLTDSGMRSVNNLVDVTNLIMLEYGQPFHAFDGQKVQDETIMVRAARQNEEIMTLDNKLRKLTPQDIVLADTQVAIDVAGIMGGKDTEVTDSTTTILLSASLFNPVMLRKTAQRLGLHSEASRRFLHGLSKLNLLQAVVAAIKMYESLGGKLTAINLVGNFEDRQKSVRLTAKRLNSLLGTAIDPNFVVSALQNLRFKVNQKIAGEWMVNPPYFRLDISQEEDLVEEVARMLGFDKIKGQKLKDETAEKLDDSLYNFIYNLKTALKEAGLTEVQTYSFYSTNVLNNFDWDKDNLVRISNPISSETEYLREDLWPNLLEVVGKNMRRGYRDIAIFEIGKAYLKKKSSLPDEKYFLAIALMNGSDNPIQELYQIYQRIKSKLGKGIKEKVGLPDKEEYHRLFHPTRFIAFSLSGKDIGGIAEIHPRIVNKFGIEKRVAVLEIDLEMLLS